jgi:hypothetical protein
MRALNPEARLDDLSPLPQVRDGRNARIHWLHDAADGRRLVLRLWVSGREVEGTPLWLGRVAYESPTRLLGLVTYPRTEPAGAAVVARLVSTLPTDWVRRDPGTGWLVGPR